ncbi:hypothetical protein B7494_g6089 [Chlorociboria aeruginascens]|nr:hypothetical protein B7494_g6089 [Chlorociboria aeruginascens]
MTKGSCWFGRRQNFQLAAFEESSAYLSTRRDILQEIPNPNGYRQWKQGNVEFNNLQVAARYHSTFRVSFFFMNIREEFDPNPRFLYLFGIDTIAKDAWTEMSIGDASVVVRSNDSDGYDQDKFIPVAVTFDKKNPKFKIHGKCGKGEHKHSSKPNVLLSYYVH